MCRQGTAHQEDPEGRKGPVEEGERLWDEMEGGMYLFRSQAHTHGHPEGQDQMELCSGDPEQGPGPQSVQEHQGSVQGGVITEHSLFFVNVFI